MPDWSINIRRGWSVNFITRVLGTAGGGSGDVVGPSGGTDNAIARFDGTTGKRLQNSLVTVSDTGSISLPTGETVDGVDVSALPAQIEAAQAAGDTGVGLASSHIADLYNPHETSAAQVGADPSGTAAAAVAAHVAAGDPHPQYTTAAEVVSALASYVLTSTLTSTLTSYVTNSALTSTLGSYVTSAALAAWTGATSITTLGTIATGTWQGTQIASTYIADAAITLAKMANLAGLSVIGNATNGSATPTAITAANDGEVLRRSGTAIGFGTVATAGIADAAITLAKMANLTAKSVIGNATNASATPTAITAATVGHALQLADDSASLGWREPSFATRTLAGAVRAGRFPEESGTPRFWPVGIANATTSTTQASVANRCIFIPEVWQWTSNQRWDALTAEVTTPSAAGTKFRLMLYAEGSDGMAASLIWTSADLAADAATEVVALLSLGTWQNTAYKDSNGYFYAPPGTNFYTALHTETTTTFRAVAASACKVISQSSGTLTSNNLMYVSGTFASGAPSSGAGPTMANGNRHIVRLRGVP